MMVTFPIFLPLFYSSFPVIIPHHSLLSPSIRLSLILISSSLVINHPIRYPTMVLISLYSNKVYSVVRTIVSLSSRSFILAPPIVISVGISAFGSYYSATSLCVWIIISPIGITVPSSIPMKRLVSIPGIIFPQVPSFHKFCLATYILCSIPLEIFQ